MPGSPTLLRGSGLADAPITYWVLAPVLLPRLPPAPLAPQQRNAVAGGILSFLLALGLPLTRPHARPGALHPDNTPASCVVSVARHPPTGACVSEHRHRTEMLSVWGSLPFIPHQAVRAVFTLQTFGTQQAKSGSRACTPPTTTRPTPASWYETNWRAKALGKSGLRGEGMKGPAGLSPPHQGWVLEGRISAGFRVHVLPRGSE